MEKFRSMQLPVIILLLLLLAIMLFQYQDVIVENSSLKLKLSESLISLDHNVTPINFISDNCIETPYHDALHKDELAKVNVEQYSNVVEQSAIPKVEIPQLNQNTKVIPFEDQEIDYEWATVMETAVSDAFQTSEILDKFTLENVECRSSVCEVRMPKGQEDTFHQAVLVLFALDELGVKHKSLEVRPEDDEGTVIFYFSKNDI